LNCGHEPPDEEVRGGAEHNYRDGEDGDGRLGKGGAKDHGRSFRRFWRSRIASGPQAFLRVGNRSPDELCHEMMGTWRRNCELIGAAVLGVALTKVEASLAEKVARRTESPLRAYEVWGRVSTYIQQLEIEKVEC
jgi:hypothetical protein